MTTINQEKPKILMVDDKPENLVVLQKLLASLDAELIKASSGNEALALTLEHDFVLILLDVQMPGMDGYEVLDMLSWDDRTKYIPVIFITANYADEKHQLKGYRYGAVDYLFKPINKEILLGKVKVFLELYEQRLQYARLHQRYQLILTAAGEGVCEISLDGIINFANPAAEKLLGWGTKDLLKKPFSILITRSKKDFSWESSAFYSQCYKGETINNSDSIFLKANGDELPVEYTASPLKNDANQLVGIVLIFSDISIRKSLEKQLTHLALYDHLTQLPNRLLFDKSINQSLARAARHNRSVALMFLDLDHFKNINDTLGHDVGDLLLQGVTERFKACVRESDTIARLGGDEFAIILDEIERPEDAAIVAEKIIEILRPPFMLNNHEVSASTSIGIAVFPISGTDVETLTKNADIAMYRAKHKGRNNYCFFTSGMNEQSRQRLNLAHSLRHVLEKNELFLCYQPILELETGFVIGLEALLRWEHPTLGIIPPNDFIPIAEEISLMDNLTEWVVKTACLKSKSWFNRYPHLRKISVNISGSQMLQGNLCNIIEQSLYEAQLSTKHLELEVTEAALMTNTIQAERVLKQLDEIGIKVAIDDFGTGYTSISFLQNLPIDTLKIDRSFIDKIGQDETATRFVKTIIAMAQNLEMKVIAEGVESEQQLTYLKNNHCHEIQGYIFCKPLTADEMEKFLLENNKKAAKQ